MGCNTFHTYDNNVTASIEHYINMCVFTTSKTVSAKCHVGRLHALCASSHQHLTCHNDLSEKDRQLALRSIRRLLSTLRALICEHHKTEVM